MGEGGEGVGIGTNFTTYLQIRAPLPANLLVQLLFSSFVQDF